MCEIIWLQSHQNKPSDNDIEWAAYEIGVAFLHEMTNMIKPIDIFHRISKHFAHLSPHEINKLEHVIDYCAESQQIEYNTAND